MPKNIPIIKYTQQALNGKSPDFTPHFDGKSPDFTPCFDGKSPD